MKKKIIIVLLITFCIFLFNINKVYANSMNIVCSSENVNVGETITCTVVGTADEPISGISASIGSDSHLEILTDTIANVSGLGGNFHIYYGGDGTIKPAGTFDIATFSVKGLTSGRGGLTLREYNDQSPLGFTDEHNTRYIGVEPVNKFITVGSGENPTPPSSDSSLTSLIPNIGELQPGFTSDNERYNMNIHFTKVNRISFATVTSDSMAIVENSSCDIPNSTSIENIICNIIVSAEDKTKTFYKITINNEDYNSDPTPTREIKKIVSVDGTITPQFSKEILNYEMNINFLNYDHITFEITLNSGENVHQTCEIPSSPNVESVTCNIDNYSILVKNTNKPDIECDLIIRSNMYTIDQSKKVIKVNSEHSLEKIKANLYSNCGEIYVYDNKAIIMDGISSSEYKIEKIIMPQTGNNKIFYSLAIMSIIVIIGLFFYIKKKYFKIEKIEQ